MSAANRPRIFFVRGIRLKLLATFLLVVIAMGAAPAFGLWMPWANETDRIKKTVKDVWFALLRADRKSVEKLLTGPAAKSFVDREMKLIQTLAITKYGFRFNKVTIDPLKGEWAWVELERLAFLKNGSTKPMTGLATFRKLEGDWKLYVGNRSRKRRAAQSEERKEKFGETAEQSSKTQRKISP